MEWVVIIIIILIGALGMITKLKFLYPSSSWKNLIIGALLFAIGIISIFIYLKYKNGK